LYKRVDENEENGHVQNNTALKRAKKLRKLVDCFEDVDNRMQWSLLQPLWNFASPTRDSPRPILGGGALTLDSYCGVQKSFNYTLPCTPTMTRLAVNVNTYSVMASHVSKIRSHIVRDCQTV